MCKVNVADLAVRAGNRSCLEVALKYGHRGCDPDTMMAAVTSGYTGCVTLLRERGNARVTAETLSVAATLGHVECVRYIAPILQGPGVEGAEWHQAEGFRTQP